MIYAVRGYEVIRSLQMVDFVRERNPMFDTEWARLYYELCPIAGVRTSIAFGQAIHETGWFLFSGRAQADWNNPCGLGVGSKPLIRNGVVVPNSADCRFLTKEEGVRAHLGHLSVYVAPHEVPGFCEIDPRHVGHRNLENDIRRFGGVWAPSPEYGNAVARMADSVLTFG